MRHHPQGQQDELGVQPGVHSLDVEVVVAQPVPGRGVGISPHVGQPGDSRQHPQPFPESRDPLLELPGQFWPLWPRTHNAHLASQDIQRLGYLIETGLPQDAAQPGCPGIVGVSPHRSQLGLGVLDHGSEFDDAEHPPVPAQPFLPVEHRPPVGE